MTSYRVARRKYADLTGVGARLYGGRFNAPGVSAIYSSQSIALALLEILVHVDKSEVPADYVAMAIQFSARGILRPGNRTAIAEVGARLRVGHPIDMPVLRVPSVIVPQEYNYVLFPEVAGYDARISWTEPLNFDSRIFSLAGQ